MRLLNIFYQKTIIAGLLLMFLGISLSAQTQAPQKTKKIRQLVDVTIKVVDDNNAPVPKAAIVVGEGILHTETDEGGSATFKAYPEDAITVTVVPFEPFVTNALDLVQNNTVKLLKSKQFLTSADVVPLPFTELKQRRLTGPDLVMAGTKFERYPSVDFRNSLTGITSGFDIREQDGSPGLSSQEGNQNYTGIDNNYGATDKFSNIPMVIIDGMPTDLQEAPIDPAEIESATWLKGIVATTMYGPQANGGALLINTKRGVKNEKMLAVDIESGVGTIDRMPGWVDGVQYANLNNEARTGSGLAPLYDQTAIDNYAQNDPNSLRYPNVNYKDMMLKNSKSMTKVNLSASGGNEIVQYFSYVGYAKEGDIYEMGADANYNRLTARQKINVKVNDQFDVGFSFYGNQYWRQSANYGYDADYTTEGTANATLSLIELPSLLADINTISPIANPVYAVPSSETVEGQPYYGVNNSFISYASGNPYGISSGYPLANPIGNVEGQGYYTDRGRTGIINAQLNYDFGKFVKGLKSNTYFGVNLHNLVRLGKENDYLAYVASISPKTGNDTLIRSTSHSLQQMSDEYKLMDYYFQRYSFYEALSYNRTFGDHDVQSILTGNWQKTFINGIEEPHRNINFVWSNSYTFKDKYSVQAVLNYAGNSSFTQEMRYKLFSAFGANWVMSDENFMSNVNFISYLKLRAQYGILGNETYLFPHYYETRWSQDGSGGSFGPAGSLQWFGTTTESGVRRTSLQRTGNSDLTWGTRQEFNVGFDATFIKNKLYAQVTYWNWKDKGAISQLNNVIPFVAGLQGGRPYSNYNENGYNSVSTDIQYTDKIGSFEFSVGVNATSTAGKRLQYDEPNYRYDYQKRTGKASDAIFGQTYIKKFDTDAEALEVPQIYDDVLKAGDLKYADMNGDGVVDDNDQSMIGHSSPRLYYGINLTMKYQGFELFILGAGRAFYDIQLTNPYYWGGWGDYNYSNFVKNNVGGSYPRLSYYKVNNNFITSNFWMTNGSYFKIQNVELSYTIPASMVQFMGSRGVKIYVRGANLLTISQVKEVDPESVNSGVSVYPLFRTFTGGVKLNF
jgi:TonB-linked SusC/RagA family outer membrane protein